MPRRKRKSKGGVHVLPREPATVEEKVDDVHAHLVRQRGTELTGMLEILTNRRKLMWINFVAGLARGVGFFLGVTLIGALLLGGIALAFNTAASSLGFKDITLEQAVGSAVHKFSEIQRLIGEAQQDLETVQEAVGVGEDGEPLDGDGEPTEPPR